MKFGRFDDKNKEYIIERPDTPRSWSNYLGTTEYGAIITNNAGGYSFYKSAAQGRFMRMRFNNIPTDQPGRYIYVHDRDSQNFWSASWQPVGKPLDKFQSICRHGTAYTVINSKYTRIETETLYFVPLGRTFECWVCKITNHDTQKRSLAVFTYVEYVGNWNAMDDQNNIQYTQYTAQMNVIDGIISHGTNVNIPEMPDNFEEKDQGRFTYQGIVGATVIGYDTDRESFLGPYRTYADPLVVESGRCTNSLAVGDNPCGTLQVNLDLEPGETREFTVFVGIGKAETDGKSVLQEFQNQKKIYNEFSRLLKFWHSRLDSVQITTPDTEFNSMMNMWSPFNCLMTYTWSRAASLIYSGARDGLGYRDTVQDLLGVMPAIPQDAGKRLELMITGQVSTGGAMPVVKPFAHHPGSEKSPEEKQYRSDDCMWLFNAIPEYVKETGDLDFYDKIFPYADKGEDTVLGHMKRAIEFNLKRSGAHGLPCGLLADWNDCLELGFNGETVFVAFQLRYALRTYIEVSERLNKMSEADWAKKHLAQLDNNLNTHTWDGNWFLRAYRYDGLKFGSGESEEGSIFLNTQTWAILSGHASQEQAKKAMDAVNQKLATKYGLMVCAPPFEKTDYTVIRATLMNPGMKENAGIFCHTQGWVVMAESMLGHGDRAFQYFRASMPAAFNENAEIRQIEPYVYCQSIHSKFSPRYGAARIPWLSGSATWAYYAATQYILGIRPDYDGLTIDPCIPAAWKEFKVTRIFRGKRINIFVDNSNGVQKGVRE
ncbi:N,N'-diacetylchitobiose phosphorylase, partial [candidate division KSB1 bacterium]|nr:N,N'-diacetylchitobiose phosphorylase [candidate division KSB1 bacterium]